MTPAGPAEDAVPALVTFDLWGVPGRAIPAALWRMARLRVPLHRTPGLRFAKLLGTSHGHSFALRGADLHHWGILATWASIGAVSEFARGPVVASWSRISTEHLYVAMRPLTSTGQWSGRAPFGLPQPWAWVGSVAAITRLTARRAVASWPAAPAAPVAADLDRSPGLQLAVGIGEAPFGVQGTFSLWSDAQAMAAAGDGGPPADVVRRPPEAGRYAEELFARLAVLDMHGRYADREV